MQPLKSKTQIKIILDFNKMLKTVQIANSIPPAAFNPTEVYNFLAINCDVHGWHDK
jgi:hypothetical protein